MKHWVSIFVCTIVLLGCEKNLGTITTTTLPHQEYHSLTCNVPIIIELSQNATQIKIITHESLHEKFTFDVVDGNLKISIDDLIFQDWEEKPKVILPVPKTLEKISLYSMIDLISDSKIVAKDLKLHVSGPSTISLSIDVEKLEVEAWSLNIDLSGRATDVEMELNGTQWCAFDLEANSYNCKLFNTTADITCRQSLSVKEGSSSVINCKGDGVVINNDAYDVKINSIED